MISTARTRWTIFVIILVMALSVSSFAQLPLPKPNTHSEIQPAPGQSDEPLGRTTPYGTVVGFMRAAQQGDLERASKYLGRTNTPVNRKQLAHDLKEILDRGLKVNLDTLSKEPSGNLNDDVSPTRDHVGVVQIGDARLDVLLDRVQKEDQSPLWLFSSETLSKVPAFTEAEEDPGLMRYVPTSLRDHSLWGIALYRWISVPLFVLLFLGIAFFVASGLTLLCGRIVRNQLQKNADLNKVGFAAPVRLFLFACLILLGALHLTTTLLARQFWLRLAVILFVVAVAWLLLRFIDFIAWSFIGHLRRTNAQNGIAAVQLIRGSAKAVAVIAAVLIILNTQGVNLATAVAGLGIGGLAIAFAAQKTIENLFGTVMLVTDSPIRMGDFCRVGDKLGTIENIGMRSTRIRTLDRTLVTVPNGQVVAMVLENFTAREKIWFYHTIGLRHETTADQLHHVLTYIHAMLCQHPMVESESARIRFVSVGSCSFDLQIFAYVLTSDYALFLEIQEELLLHTVDIIRASGAQIALPSQMTYLATGGGSPETRGSDGAVIMQHV